MRSFKDYYGNTLEDAKNKIESVSEDIQKKYPNSDFVKRLDRITKELDEIKDNMTRYPM